MANEYLQRTPTSTGNRRVWTASLWYKMSSAGGFFGAGDGSTAANSSHWWFNSDQLGYSNNDGTNYVTVLRKSRDFSSWSHYMLVVDTTKVEPYDRVVFYENGVRNEVDTTSGYTNPSRNAELSWINQLWSHHIGARNRAGANTFSTGEYCDFFFIDGQALTPDVFGFYKQGKGYISVGSTQATDFRPGQWVPKTPRVIKTEIIRRGGFGVNGFYLPMNDSKNFGADFHCDPNSIITLNEKLPQPRVGVASTAVGIGYTDALRADPYAANLVLAIPGVIGGQGSGYGDYSANIKGSGSNKTVTANGNAGVAVTASYYGSALSFDGSGDYFNLGTNADFNFGSGDFTIEFWRNKSRSAVESYVARLDAGGGSATSDFWFGNVSGVDGFYWYQGGTGRNVSSPSLSTGQWDHLAAVRYGNTIILYVNGVAVGVNTAVTYSFNNGTADFRIGGDSVNSGNVSYPFQGSIQDLRIYKGVAKYTGGFDVPRPYTPVGIATWRAVPDTTANNFATWNAVQTQGVPSFSGSVTHTYSNGNLTVVTGTGAYKGVTATVGVSTGKYYWEYYDASGVLSGGITVISPSGSEQNIRHDTARIYVDGSLSQSGLTADASGNIFGYALDATNNTFQIYCNGSTYGTQVNYSSGAGINLKPYFPFFISRTSASSLTIHANFGQNPSFSGNTTTGTFTDSNGKGLFKYQPPSGFLALCEDNLPTPAISDPGKYFRTVLWTGDGNSGRSIVGVGFTPDLVWIKSRSPSAYSNRLFDSVRGVGKDNFLLSNLTSAEGDYADQFGGISSFDSDGFSMVFGSRGSNIGINESGTNFVAWCWRAGAGTTSTNTNGSITSVVSVNQDAGFSIVSFTAQTSGSSTVGHGLGKPPAFWIYKPRNNTTGWYVYHKSLGASAWLNFNTAAATTVNNAAWGGVNPTSSVFTHGSGLVNQGNIIMYCWAEIEGFSKFGSYVGNGNADGPFVYCNFSPAFVLIKRATGGTGNWAIFDNSRDSTNPVFGYLVAESSAVEERGTAVIDFTSNGFKIRNSWTTINSSGDTIIFAAFAQSPFSYSNSK